MPRATKPAQPAAKPSCRKCPRSAPPIAPSTPSCVPASSSIGPAASPASRISSTIPSYAGGGTHENLTGQDLDFHVDFNFHPSRALHRRLNLIVFLNPRWDASWGGCLELRQDPWAEEEPTSRKVLPLLNRAVIFATTEASWHGFSRIELPEGAEPLSRRSIAVYFYTKERPPEQTAPSHGTVYIPRALPSRFEAGHTLSSEDAHELQILIARRDAQIRFLYEREKETTQVIAAMMKSPSFRIGRALTWPLRKAFGKD